MAKIAQNGNHDYDRHHRDHIIMPSFHHSVAVLPLPFFRSVATVAVTGENGNAGNVFPYT